MYTAETIGVSAYLGGSGLLSINPRSSPRRPRSWASKPATPPALAYALNALNGATLQTAPLATDKNTIGINGADQPLTADQVLYQGGQVAAGPAAGHGRHNAGPFRPERVCLPACALRPRAEFQR